MTEVTTKNELGESVSYDASNLADVRFTDSAGTATASTGGAGGVGSAVCLPTSYDSEAIDPGMFTVLPTGIRERSRIWVLRLWIEHSLR